MLEASRPLRSLVLHRVADLIGAVQVDGYHHVMGVPVRDETRYAGVGLPKPCGDLPLVREGVRDMRVPGALEMHTE